MTKDPVVIQLDVRHFHELLKLHCATRTRVQVMELLAEAQASVHDAETEARFSLTLR